MLRVNTAIKIWDILVEAGASRDEITKMSFWLRQSKEFCPKWKFGDGLCFKRNGYPNKTLGEENWQITSDMELSAERAEVIAKVNLQLLALKRDCPNEL